MSKGKWIEFVGGQTIPGGKTKLWEVRALNAEALGEVKWYTPWRCYSFFPRPATLYEKQCLRDIAEFCEQQTVAQRAESKSKIENRDSKIETFVGPFSPDILAKMTRPIRVLAHTDIQLGLFTRANQIPKALAVRIREPRDLNGLNPSQPILRLDDWKEGTREVWEILNAWNARGGTFIDVPEETFVAPLKNR